MSVNQDIIHSNSYITMTTNVFNADGTAQLISQELMSNTRNYW